MLSDKAQKIWDLKWNPKWSLGYHPLQNDLTDKRYGKLTVIQPTTRIKWGRRVWTCLCDCGNVCEVYAKGLVSGNTKSCGCLRIDNNPKRLKEGEAAFNSLYGTYKIAARRRGLEFSLSKKEFKELTSDNCYICGQEPSKISKRPQNTGIYTYNGVDRIDNNKGYTLENCKPCCTTCNIRKHAASLEELLQWVKRVYKYNEL